MAPLHKAPRWQERSLLLLSTTFCLLYGLFLIALTHTTADGSWYWYATSLRQGTRLYADLHLAMQPLYAMELATFLRYFGPSWLAAQLPACANLLLFTGSLLLVSLSLPLRYAWRALLMCCVFAVTMGFIMMRFDDYHVLSASFELLAAAALLRLSQPASTWLRLALLGCLGMLCGLCIMNRLNDGGLLFGASCAALAFTASPGGLTAKVRHAAQSIAIVAAATLFVIAAILRTLHETFANWKLYSITRAAAIKGGTGHLLLYPFRLPFGTIHELLAGGWRFFLVLFYVVAIAAIVAYGAERTSDVTNPQRRRRILITVAFTVLVLSLPFHTHFTRGNVARILVSLLVFTIYVASAIVLVRLVQHVRGRSPEGWSARELIVLLPLGQLVSISMSAARWYPNTYPAAAVFLMLLPIGLPWWFASTRQRAVWLSLVALLLISATADKIRDPFDWFNYRVRSLDAQRIWIMHPQYGRMWMQRDQLALFSPVCKQIGGSSELLSLPFTYANYFCNVAPWHGYVQTFYDTSSRQTIETLQNDLDSGPPEWILYQRQLDVLTENEKAFNAGHPLPHRALDAYLMRRLRSGEWTATQEASPFRDTSTWLLIHTRPRKDNASPEASPTH